MLNSTFLHEIARYFPQKADSIKSCFDKFHGVLDNHELDLSMHGDGLKTQ